MKYKTLIIILLFCDLAAFTQQLPLYSKQNQAVKSDWLVDKINAKTRLYTTPEGYLVLSNGIVSRTFAQKPNGATVSLDLLSTNEAFLRSVRPEAEIEIDGTKYAVGGLTGQPIHNYLLPKWLAEMTAIPGSFTLCGYKIENTKERFPWKKRSEWMPKDMPWPPSGKELIFSYTLNDSVKHNYLNDIEIRIHYELYDGMPVFSKWMELRNNSSQTVKINSFKSEILAVIEGESVVDTKKKWELPNMTLETDYNFGGMTNESIQESSIAWNMDTLYKTQVNYERTTPCLLEVCPKYGPEQEITPGAVFTTYRVWELLHDSKIQERRGLEHRRMMRSIAPWATENPILMHVRSASDEAVKKAIDQCAEVGFEMVIMTFGSGFNAEDKSQENLMRMKNLTDYAHTKGIALGGYSLLASRHIDAENDVVMPEGKSPRFGNSPCIESLWGQEYFARLYNLYEKSGLDILEHDGSYPGDICISGVHPGHKGVGDSQWNQFKRITDFYKWCRSKGIYLNVPDYYFLSGSNKTGMGYRETNWSLPREQQEIIERQNVYDGTWTKTPSMGWMFVPLVEYHGGGKAATIEPLREHLPHYGQRLANLFGAGVQACYRGPQLYDAPETKALVEKWVQFYKKHRQILDADIIHIRRPDGRDYDAILHVDPQGVEKGLLMVYNPLDEAIEREIEVPVYYTGLKTNVLVSERDDKPVKRSISRDYKITLKIKIPAKGNTYFVLT